MHGTLHRHDGRSSLHVYRALIKAIEHTSGEDSYCVRPPKARGGGAEGFASADDHTTAASPAAAMTARILRACLLRANSDSTIIDERLCR